MKQPLYSMGRIVDIRKEDQPFGYLVQGEEAKQCVNGRGYTGGNGTFVQWAGGGVNHWLWLDVSVYANQNHKASIDIREAALTANSRTHVTDKFIKSLKDKNVGRKINLVCSDETNWQWGLADLKELELTV